ncbi:DUF551 domain-containing protein [Hafnia alvei]|uniref:DUF551 domain-containing protein n=1 Tax=Hafnia alvei TaxID=569 RepID=UPI002DBCF928|nr:DUF551 domain-containing protein [Hafnia alvei]MEB7891839.1 DUF551 domain-containing protein [Hafnia alvei]
MTKFTTELLETIATWRGTYGNGANVMIPAEEAELMARQLLAYEQAAKNPVAWIVHMRTGDQFTTDGDFVGLAESTHGIHSTPLYAAPVLPKQPELVENLKKVMNSWLSMESKLAFQPEFTDVMMLLDGEAAPAQPVIPRELFSFVTDADIAALHRFAECCDDPESGGHDLEKEQVQRLEKVGTLQRSGRISYITDFGDYLISATAPVNAQQNEPQNIPENIPAQPVSEPYKLISVKDDTPTESGDYWCYLGKDFESSTKYRVVHFDVRHHEFQDHRVTHWMRLPAEPEQEA